MILEKCAASINKMTRIYSEVCEPRDQIQLWTDSAKDKNNIYFSIVISRLCLEFCIWRMYCCIPTVKTRKLVQFQWRLSLCPFSNVYFNTNTVFYFIKPDICCINCASKLKFVGKIILKNNEKEQHTVTLTFLFLWYMLAQWLNIYLMYLCSYKACRNEHI